MNKKVIVKQNGCNDCGASCLLSVMKYYGCNASHEEVTFILKTDYEGTNAYNIINGCKSFGFNGYGIHYTYDEIINSKIKLPIICHVLMNGMYHFIVIYEVKKNYLLVMDPASNNTKIYFDNFKKIYLNTSLVIYPVKKIGKLDDYKSFENFISYYFYNEKNNIIKVFIFGLFEIILSIIFNYYVLICIDYILPNYKYKILLICSITFLFLSIIKNIFNYIKNNIINTIEKNMYLNINTDIIKKFFNLPYNFFKNKSLGESTSRLNDINYFNNYFSQIILSLGTDSLLVIISFIILLNINIKLFLIFIVEIILYYLITKIFKRKLLILNDNVLIDESNYNKSLCEGINGFETNLNINCLNNTIKNIEINNIKYLNSRKIFNKNIYNQVFLKDIINSIFYVLSIIVSIVYINKNIITLGEFMLFNTIIYYFIDPLKNIIDISLNIDYVKNIYNRIYDLILVKERDNKILNINLKYDLTINNLEYYPDGINYLFKNITFKIKYGSKYLIYGGSGMGKSTIIKIIMKYFDDYKGNIYIGKYNLKDITNKDILNNFTYVSQNGFINNDTLKNNIIYGRNVSDEEYENVIKLCNLDKLRDSKVLRNDFIIEDNGFNISGGERQKIILARSLLNKFNYLILDEALSEVGIDEEIMILKKLFNIYKEKTIICISHKNEIIDFFDNKYKLERR